MSFHREIMRIPARPVEGALRDKGQRAHLSGLAAEDAVIARYHAMGLDLAERRWRGQSGEIDLIFRDGAALVFVEVKKAVSFDAAAARLRPAQMRRIQASAEEYLAHAPHGQLTEMRFDLAAVDGQGRVEIRENAFGHF